MPNRMQDFPVILLILPSILLLFVGPLVHLAPIRSARSTGTFHYSGLWIADEQCRNLMYSRDNITLPPPNASCMVSHNQTPAVVFEQSTYYALQSSSIYIVGQIRADSRPRCKAAVIAWLEDSNRTIVVPVHVEWEQHGRLRFNAMLPLGQYLVLHLKVS